MTQYFPSPKTYLVADPNNSVVEGDVVRIASGYRFSKQIRHVVTGIVAPFGPPAEERPPVLTEEQLMQRRLEQRLEKDVRSKERGRLISVWRLKEARAAGYKIPDLETAMRNVRLQEAEEAAKLSKKGGQAHSGQTGQMQTAAELKRLQRAKTAAAEKAAEAKLKEAKKQIETEKREKVLKAA